jgi:F-type H+-transporting ATPase subunit a
MMFLASEEVANGSVHAAGGDEMSALGHVLDNALIRVGDTPVLTWHMVTLFAAFFVLIIAMVLAAKSIATGPESQGHRRYLASSRLGQLVEVMVIYMRDNVVDPVLGDNTRKFLPFLLSLFFFVLACNLIGLIPLLDFQHLLGTFFLGDSHFAWIGGTPTGNLAVTGALALVAFIVINVHGIRENGIGGWLHHLLGGAPVYLAPIMVPVELLSMFIKPGALAIRLFANMFAGHTLMATLAMFGVMALNGTGSWLVAGPISVISIAFSVAITFLELFVAFLQAFIFMFLTAVFLGQMNHHGHHDHATEHLEHGFDEHEGMFSAEVNP